MDIDIDADVNDNMNILDLDLELDLNVNVISPMWPENDFNLTDDLSFVTSTSDFVWDIPIEGFEDFNNHSSNVPMTCKIQIAENVLDAAPESETEPVTNTFDSLFELEVFNECLKDIDNPIELVPYTTAPIKEEEIITTEWNRNRRRSLLYDKNEFVQSEERQRYQERRVKATSSSASSSSTSIIQSTNRIYKCSVRDCDKTYYKASHLKSHMRRHSGVKPFACDWDGCKWRFSRSDELARHKRSHSGVKPYSCDLCDKAFSRSDHLSKHAKVHMKKLALYGTPIITKKCNYKYLTYNRISLDSL